MSTTHHQVGTCDSLEACEFTGENTLGRETLCGSWGRQSRVSVSAVAGVDLAKLPTKSAQDCSESSVCTSNDKRIGFLGVLLEDEVGKMCTRPRAQWICNSKSQTPKGIGALLEDEAGDCGESSFCISKTVARVQFAFQSRKKIEGSEHFWRMRLARVINSLLPKFTDSATHWFIESFTH